jgi:hypothetical protein
MILSRLVASFFSREMPVKVKAAGQKAQGGLGRPDSASPTRGLFPSPQRRHGVGCRARYLDCATARVNAMLVSCSALRFCDEWLLVIAVSGGSIRKVPVRRGESLR